MRLCRRSCLAGAGAAGSILILMPPPKELGCRRLPPFAVHGAAVPSPAVALRVPVPVPALCQCPVATLLLAAPMMLGALLSLCFLPVLAPAAGDAARECGLGAETGGRGATSPGTLGLVAGASTTYKAFVDQGPGAQRRVNAGCSWLLAAGSGKVPGALTSSGSGAWAWPWAWRGIHFASPHVAASASVPIFYARWDGMDGMRCDAM